jgi:hypothetical protein
LFDVCVNALSNLYHRDSIDVKWAIKSKIYEQMSHLSDGVVYSSNNGGLSFEFVSQIANNFDLDVRTKHSPFGY